MYVKPQTHMWLRVQPASKVLDFLQGGKLEGPDKNPHGTGENQCTTLLTYGPSRESNQGHIGEKQALYALAIHATSFKEKNSPIIRLMLWVSQDQFHQTLKLSDPSSRQI